MRIVQVIVLKDVAILLGMSWVKRMSSPRFKQLYMYIKITVRAVENNYYY